MKSYIECLDEISSDELFKGLLAYGMFAEKLPPIFSSVCFYEYCVNNQTVFTRDDHKYIFYESIRNTNIPRPFGIPTPMQYANLCKDLSDNWEEIRNVFRNNTASDQYKVSRIHIRKRFQDNSLLAVGYEEQSDENEYDQIPITPEAIQEELSLFSMNYRNWKTDGDPILFFSMGKRYVVRADISQCFPSIYTHAIPWALVGKQVAKSDRNQRRWFNKIDKSCRNMRDGETHGLLIGPHSSNLLSELILTCVDKEMMIKGYDYIRNIDDYTCYVEKYEDAEKFLIELNEELRKFDFSINHKKTKIEKLPQASSEFWVHRLQDKPVKGQYPVVDFNSARAYLDTAIMLMEDNGNNASAITFAIKVLGKNELSTSAKEYCVKTMCNLAIIYPYLVPIMDKYVFDAFNASVLEIEKFAQLLYANAQEKQNYEGISYAIFYAMKYNFLIDLDVDAIIHSSDCVSKVSLLRYSRIKGDIVLEERLKDEARRLQTIGEFDENWIFIFEALPVGEMPVGEWHTLKAAGISFLT